MKLGPALILIIAIVCIAASAGICETTASSACPEARASFDVGYQSYKAACSKWCNERPGYSAWRYRGEELVEMGPAAVPFLIEKMEKREDANLFPRQFSAVAKITRKRFPTSEYSSAARAGTMGDLFVRWWKVERKQTPARFATLSQEWERCLKEGDRDRAQEASDQIRDMGVDALPLVIEKIKGGEQRFVPLVAQIMGEPVGGDVPTPDSVLQWWAANEKLVRLPDPSS